MSTSCRLAATVLPALTAGAGWAVEGTSLAPQPGAGTQGALLAWPPLPRVSGPQLMRGRLMHASGTSWHARRRPPARAVWCGVAGADRQSTPTDAVRDTPPPPGRPLLCTAAIYGVIFAVRAANSIVTASFRARVHHPLRRAFGRSEHRSQTTNSSSTASGRLHRTRKHQVCPRPPAPVAARAQAPCQHAAVADPSYLRRWRRGTAGMQRGAWASIRRRQQQRTSSTAA
jgi:hypothetical protein